MLSRSFIDVLFILLLGTIVMLTRAVQIDAVETDLLRLGRGGSTPLDMDDVQIVVVDDGQLTIDGASWPSVEPLIAALRPDAPVVLVVDGSSVSHARVMETFVALREAGFPVNLGVAPSERDRKGG